MFRTYTNRGRTWELANSWWVVLTWVPLSLASFIAFFYIGSKVKNRRWTAWGFFYLITTWGLVPITNNNLISSEIAALTAFTLWIMSIVHASKVRPLYLIQLDVITHGEKERLSRLRQEAEARFHGGAAPGMQPPQRRQGPMFSPGLGADEAPFAGPLAGGPAPAAAWPPPPGAQAAPSPQPVPPQTTPSPQPPMAPPAAPSQQTSAAPQAAPFQQPPQSAPFQQPSQSASFQQQPISRPIDLNTASEAEMAAVPGIGIILAKRIAMKRQETGAFRSFEEFAIQMGLNEQAAGVLRTQVSFSQPEPQTEPKPGTPRSGRVIDY
ncbi:helix-hairpin-helix domain-containing protein [Shouchella clausii]